MAAEKTKLKILILGVGGNVSQGIIKALKNSELNMELIGACISPQSIGLYMCEKAYISPYSPLFRKIKNRLMDYWFFEWE